MALFISIFSPNNIQVRALNKIIPIPNPISLEGQTLPLNASAKYCVAKIETYETITPGIATRSGLSFDQLDMN